MVWLPTNRKTEMTVYVTQNPMRRNTEQRLVHMFDLAPARHYGALEVLLPAGRMVDQGLAHVATTLRERLADFTDDDYLLCLGDPVAIAMASAVVAQVNAGRVPLLVWDKLERRYTEVIANTAPTGTPA